jgi:ribose 5-phosphate isomerase B
VKRIIMGCDHGGFGLKTALKDFLLERGDEVEDVGCHSEAIVRYPYYAAMVASAVSEGAFERGILICSTGIGMSMAANKYPGIRAALCATSYQGKMTAAHNASNVLCLGGRCIGLFEARDILANWLDTPYEGGRHDISLGLLDAIEKTNLSGGRWLKPPPEIQ